MGHIMNLNDFLCVTAAVLLLASHVHAQQNGGAKMPDKAAPRLGSWIKESKSKLGLGEPGT